MHECLRVVSRSVKLKEPIINFLCLRSLYQTRLGLVDRPIDLMCTQNDHAISLICVRLWNSTIYLFLINLPDIICTRFCKAPLLNSMYSAPFAFLYVSSTRLCPQDPHQHQPRRLTYQHKHAPPPTPPMKLSTNTDAIRRICLYYPSILSPIQQSIHPDLPPKRMEPRMLPLPQLLPLLKGTPAPVVGQLFSTETTDDIKIK